MVSWITREVITILKPLKPCKNVSCVELTRNVYCDKHKPKETRRDSAAWRYLYNTKRWKNMRAKQLILNPFCVECERNGARNKATNVDHIQDHKGDKQLFFDVNNLQSLCHPCHSRKTALENPPPTIKKF